MDEENSKCWNIPVTANETNPFDECLAHLLMTSACDLLTTQRAFHRAHIVEISRSIAANGGVDITTGGIVR